MGWRSPDPNQLITVKAQLTPDWRINPFQKARDDSRISMPMVPRRWPISQCISTQDGLGKASHLLTFNWIVRKAGRRDSILACLAFGVNSIRSTRKIEWTFSPRDVESKNQFLPSSKTSWARFLPIGGIDILEFFGISILIENMPNFPRRKLNTLENFPSYSSSEGEKMNIPK